MTRRPLIFLTILVVGTGLSVFLAGERWIHIGHLFSQAWRLVLSWRGTTTLSIILETATPLLIFLLNLFGGLQWRLKVPTRPELLTAAIVTLAVSIGIVEALCFAAIPEVVFDDHESLVKANWTLRTQLAATKKKPNIIVGRGEKSVIYERDGSTSDEPSGIYVIVTDIDVTNDSLDNAVLQPALEIYAGNKSILNRGAESGMPSDLADWLKNQHHAVLDNRIPRVLNLESHHGTSGYLVFFIQEIVLSSMPVLRTSLSSPGAVWLTFVEASSGHKYVTGLFGTPIRFP